MAHEFHFCLYFSPARVYESDVVAVWQRELSQHALDTQVLPMNAEEASEVNMRQGIVIATASSQHCPPQICVQWDRYVISVSLYKSF
eukprot:m.120042 g.120042  ORF g.120042 m.120042 type:complete len:87 (-) comp13683_c0_seq17:484-744(-)